MGVGGVTEPHALDPACATTAARFSFHTKKRPEKGTEKGELGKVGLVPGAKVVG